MNRTLCSLNELKTREQLAAGDAEDRPGSAFMLLMDGPSVRAFENRCPHTGAPLDWMPGRFLSSDRKYIQCSIHHALFRIADGLCIDGPCLGQSLTPVPVVIRDGDISIAED